MFPLFITVMIITIIVYVVARLLAGAAKRPSTQVNPQAAVATRWVARGFAVLGALFFFLGSLASVSTKNVGIETAFGKTTGHLSNGLHLKWPWVGVTEMDAAIQTDSYNGGRSLDVRIANQQTANVSISIRWRIESTYADSLFQNYRTFDNVRDSLVTRELHAAVNQQFGSYNPLDSIQVGSSAAGVGNRSLNELAAAITAQMRREVANQGVDVLNTIIPIVTFDPDTQNRINQLQQQIAQTRIAQQQLQTNSALARANGALASSVNTSPNVLVAQCLDILSTMVKQRLTVPAGFSCWPGGGVAGIIANSKP